MLMTLPFQKAREIIKARNMARSSILKLNLLLNNDFEVPAIGLGTFQGDAGNSKVRKIVLEALNQGYRHIDCATAYGNEQEVGEAIKQSGVPRQELFITTKLAQTWHEPTHVEASLAENLKALQLDYVDLYLMHFPHAYKAGNNHAQFDIRAVMGNLLSTMNCPDDIRRPIKLWGSL